MSWWLGPSIIGVIAAGILAGLLASYLILRGRNKVKMPSFNIVNQSAGSFPTERPSEETPEAKTKPVISVDDNVDAYLNQVKGSPPASNTSNKLSAALVELENNLAIASRPKTNNVINFHTDIWNNKRSEFNLLSSALIGELTEAYVDMLLANNIVWLVTELGRNSQDLIDSYYKLSNKIAERLQRVMPEVRDSLSP
jgi:hypothetical protein